MTAIPIRKFAERSRAEIEASLSAAVETRDKSYITIGRDLMEIRDRRLYKPEFKTFEAYCHKQWDMDRTYAHRVIEAAKTAENLLPMGNIPQTERQARELAPLPADRQREVWGELTRENSQPTARAIRNHVKRALSSLKTAPNPRLTRVDVEERVAQFKAMVLEFAALGRPVPSSEINQRLRELEAVRNVNALFTRFIHCTYSFPWVTVEKVNATYLFKINQPLFQVCEHHHPLPELKGWSAQQMAAFIGTLQEEIERKEEAARVNRTRRGWNLNTVVKLELVELLDWIKTELRKIPCP